MAVDMKQLHLQVFCDSQLVINQLLGSYEVKKFEFRPYHYYSEKLIGWLEDVTLQYVRRMENKKANALDALASLLALPDQTQVTICQKWIVPPPNEDEYAKDELEHLVAISKVAKEDWRQPIIDYMCYGILPENPRRRTDIRRHEPRFLYYKDTLYQRSLMFGKGRSNPRSVRSTLRMNIIYRYGIPRYKITDNGKTFDNKICDLFGFKQRKSSMYNVAANGLVEAFNKTLFNLLKEVVSKSK
ncbi:hypothetical protein KY290_010637 [Solanum tuberosum]|uniref:Integrase catalytic domain-containing protein n=1 Tax=Solanum tuberosum TaxID=4113 RepID=A0ABQ7VYD6_SOLTU|nr:hypothetical protein KY290_010637 [Solanum tuberosum]